MHFKALILSSFVVLTMRAGKAFGMLIPNTPATIVAHRDPRQPIPLATTGPSGAMVTQDPWQCVRENITQYFLNVPKPTGVVLDGINSFGFDVAKPCRATATGGLALCTVSDPKSWCGFSTAAPPAVLASYSTYVSAVTSFWKANSATISALSTMCPVAWMRPNPAKHEWLKIAIAHAECHIQSMATKTL